MTVVSNTSPINYLVLIGRQDVLLDLFGRVAIPEAVARELGSLAAPEPVRNWIEHPPAWLDIRQAPPIPEEFQYLGAGEREAIAITMVADSALVLLDERRARQMAREHDLRVSGTLHAPATTI